MTYTLFKHRVNTFTVDIIELNYNFYGNWLQFYCTNSLVIANKI